MESKCSPPCFILLPATIASFSLLWKGGKRPELSQKHLKWACVQLGGPPTWISVFLFGVPLKPQNPKTTQQEGHPSPISTLSSVLWSSGRCRARLRGMLGIETIPKRNGVCGFPLVLLTSKERVGTPKKTSRPHASLHLGSFTQTASVWDEIEKRQLVTCFT